MILMPFQCFVFIPNVISLCNFMLDVSAYCVVAVEAAGRQIPIAFLERVKDDFNKRYGGGKAATAVAKSLNKEFGYLFLSFLKDDIFFLFFLILYDFFL